MQYIFRGLLISAVALCGACTMVAPNYSASIPNIQKLKDAQDFKAAAGPFTAVGADAHDARISIRANSMVSPYGKSYAAYVREALRQELEFAGKLAPDATLEISGTLTKNDLDASGFSKGYGGIEARFIVKRAGVVRYDAIKSASNEWVSSFVGAVAIPNAQAAYPELVQKLLSTLYADPQFIAALQ